MIAKPRDPHPYGPGWKLRYPGNDPENGPAELHYFEDGRWKPASEPFCNPLDEPEEEPCA